MACFCLTSEDLDALEFVETQSECAIRCSGNSKERCGGAFSLTVYMNGKLGKMKRRIIVQYSLTTWARGYKTLFFPAHKC